MAHGPLTRRTKDPLTRAQRGAPDHKSGDRGDAPHRPSRSAPSLSFDQALDEFLLAGRARSLSPKTLDWYQMIGRRFVRIQTERGADPALNAVTTGQARGFVVALQDAGLARVSVVGFVRGLKVILGWCAAGLRARSWPICASPTSSPRASCGSREGHQGARSQ
jgi:hypothetical protein